MNIKSIETALSRAKRFHLGNNARARFNAPGDDTNITINTNEKVVVEKLYLVMNMDDYWGTKDKEN
ncbi:hypothetical protein SynWH8103_02577 [Synechococcus sp. WH 8103]|nr:hypothetical protein SynWH8103_02577 [Synechococcus sp. WH 8103]